MRFLLFIFLLLAPLPSIAADVDPPTLREYILTLLAKRDRQYQQRFDSQEKALATAAVLSASAVDRAELTNQIRLKAMTDKLDDLTNRFNTVSGRSQGVDWSISLLMAGLGLAAGVIGAVFARNRNGAAKV